MREKPDRTDPLFETETEDVWHRMQNCGKPIVMYGMGNGADKILAVMERYGITVSDFFASDGFVRGHSFHGKTVLSYSAVREKYGDMLIVISFASSLPEVLARFDEIDNTYETVAPDVPVFGDTLFTAEYYQANRAAFACAEALLADEESRRIFRAVLRYKYTGKLSYLREAVSDPEDVNRTLLHTESITSYMDLGAYNGDTVRAMLEAAPHLQTVYALEPDARSFKKLAAYAESETRAEVSVYPYAAWSKTETLTFRVEGNRNSSVAGNGTSGIRVSQAKEKQIAAARPDEILAGQPVDYIKYDVEGSEAEALRGTAETIARYAPKLLVSAYHRSEDLFALPFQIHEMQPSYRLYLRRFAYVPAWDVNLYCIPGLRSEKIPERAEGCSVL